MAAAMFRKITSSILFMLLMAALLFKPGTAKAQQESPYDIIAEVNTLRASEGLEPYVISPWIMAYAQEHAGYLAGMQHGSHVHSDESYPQDIGLQENVASGEPGYITPSVAVNQVWSDWGHRHILTGYPGGEIGAGMAHAADGQVYYTVNIRPAALSGTALPVLFTPAPFVPLTTSTPDSEGMILHVVGEGQTLWSIAVSYGVTMADIRRLNGLASDATLLFPGQKLTIRQGKLIETMSPPALTGTVAQTRRASASPEGTALPVSETVNPTSTFLPAGVPERGSPSWWVPGVLAAAFLIITGVILLAFTAAMRRGQQKR